MTVCVCVCVCVLVCVGANRGEFEQEPIHSVGGWVPLLSSLRLSLFWVAPLSPTAVNTPAAVGLACLVLAHSAASVCVVCNGVLPTIAPLMRDSWVDGMDGWMDTPLVRRGVFVLFCPCVYAYRCVCWAICLSICLRVCLSVCLTVCMVEGPSRQSDRQAFMWHYAASTDRQDKTRTKRVQGRTGRPRTECNGWYF